MTVDASTEKSILIQITNFQTPFSAQNLRTLDVRYYSDEYCTRDRATTSMPSITIQGQLMPTENIFLESSSDVLGNTKSSTYLDITFTPQTTMPPGGAGHIDIGMPYQYFLTTSGRRMYNPTATNKCSSSCMNIFESELIVDRIKIIYDNMVESCIKGAPITISCRQFYNPIVPEDKSGFFIITYDNEVDERVIEESSKTEVVLDAKAFTPAIIPIQNFIVDPTNVVVSTFSTWTIQLTVNIPMEQDCWIDLILPPDFIY